MARALLALLVLLLPACGNGTLADIWSRFPADQFPGGGDGGGGGGGGGGGTFTPRETAFLDDAQGITGDVRNVALAIVGAQTLAFLSAQTEGVHIVDVTAPNTITQASVRGRIPGTLLAGGRADAVAVVDETYLVALAVGAVDVDGNAVSVFHVPSLLTILATPPPHDFAPALAPRIGTGAIAAPGNDEGKAAGVSGALSAFLVATGGNSLGTAAISPGVPGSWTAGPAFTPSSPPVDHVLDVLVNGTNAYLSVESAGTFGILAVSLVPTPTVTTPTVLTVPGTFSTLATDPIAGPGNFGLDLARDGSTLFVTGRNAVSLFNLTNPAVPAPLPPPANQVGSTGADTIAVTGGLGNGGFAVGAGDRVRVFSPSLTAGFAQEAEVVFAAPATMRGLAPRSAATGRFLLCCAGSRGLRVVQWRNTP